MLQYVHHCFRQRSKLSILAATDGGGQQSHRNILRMLLSAGQKHKQCFEGYSPGWLDQPGSGFVQPMYRVGGKEKAEAETHRCLLRG